MVVLSRLSLRHPFLAMLALVGVTAALGLGASQLRSEFGYRVLVGHEHPAIQELDRFIEAFGGGIPVQIAWECSNGAPCQSVFDERSLAMAHAVTQQLSSRPGIQTIRGISNAPLLVPTRDGFAVRRFVERDRPAEDVAELRRRALADPLWRNALVSESGRVGIIAVQPTDTRNQTSLRLLDSLDQALAPHREHGFRFHLVGDPVSSILAGRDLAESTNRLVPLTVLVIALVVLGLMRSWPSVVASLATMGIALVWTFGLLGWLDWPQDGILEVLAPLILVVGVCDSIHLLSRSAARSAGPTGRLSEERRRSLLAAARDVATPCLITSLTTAAAFASFTSSALDTFVRFGVISAFGVLACLVLTFTLLPLLAWALPEGGGGPQRANQLWEAVLDAVVRTARRRAVPILLTGATLGSLGAFGWLGFLRVDTDWYESLGEHSQVIRGIRFLERHMGQSETLEVEIALPPESTLEQPEVLTRVAGFSDFLGRVDGLGRPRSIVEVLRRLNRLVHDDDSDFERIPDSLAANAELIELASLDDSAVLAGWLSLDRSSIRISVDAPEQSQTRARRVLETVRSHTASSLPSDWRVTLTGQTAMNVYWVADLQDTQLRSFPVAFALVLVMVAVFLRSARLALAAMVPTLLPVLATLGALGFLGMSLDFGRAMIAAIMIGIAVDDSVHLLDAYRKERACGATPGAAMEAALHHTGRAVITTSLALALGFLTLVASAWQTISSFGFFVALGILAALGATLYLLPALFFALERR
jgi:predicted RND superfamily exporter protein